MENNNEFEIDYTFMFLYPEAQYPNHPEFVKQILSGDYTAKELYAMRPKEILSEISLDFFEKNSIEDTSNLFKSIANKLLEERKKYQNQRELKLCGKTLESKEFNEKDLSEEELKALLILLQVNSKHSKNYLNNAFPSVIRNKNIVLGIDKIDENNITDFNIAELYPMKDGKFYFGNVEEMEKNIIETNKKLETKILVEGRYGLSGKNEEEILNEQKNLLSFEEAIFIKQKATSICLNCKAIFIGKPEKCSVCNHGLFQGTHENNQQFAINYLEVLNEYRNDIKIFNINEKIKFVPNAEGIQLIYDYLNRHLENTKYQYTLEMILKDIDLETGQYEMQMWDFMNTFGGHIKMGFDGPFKENNIFIHSSKFK